MYTLKAYNLHWLMLILIAACLYGCSCCDDCNTCGSRAPGLKNVEMVGDVSCPDPETFESGNPPPFPPDFKPEFAIIQINDVYRVDSVRGGKEGGLGRVASVVTDTKKQVDNVYILHAGDFLSPSLESIYFKGQQMVDALNFLSTRYAPMYVVPGNHEFDDNNRPDILVNAINGSRFTWVSSNLKLEAGCDALKNEIHNDLLEDWGGRKVGLFALTIDTDDMDKKNGVKKNNIAYAAFNDNYIDVASEEIRKLEKQGAEIIIGLTHLSYDDDLKIAELRKYHDNFLWIAGGHEHTVHCHDLSPGSAFVSKGDSNARSIWRIYFGTRNGTTTFIPQRLVLEGEDIVDKQYKKEIEDKYRKKLRNKTPGLDDKIGSTDGGCVDGTEEALRNEESTWGDYLTDRMRETPLCPSVKADIAFLNGGSIRIDDKICGDITRENILRTFNYPTDIVYVRMNGKCIRDSILKNAVSGGEGEGRFLQVSGLKFTFDKRKPEGERIISVVVDGTGESLRDDDVYVVAVTKYLFEGHDGYDFKCAEKNSEPVFLEASLKRIVEDSLSRGDKVPTEPQGRIIDKSKSEKICPDDLDN